MPNSNKTIFLLKERIRATNLSYKKNKIQNDTKFFISNKKILELEKELRNLNKSLKETEKKVSTLRLQITKDGEKKLLKEIKAPLIEELRLCEAVNNNLNKKLQELLTTISKEQTPKPKPKKEIKILEKKILKYKEDISKLKKQIQKTRNKLNDLKFELTTNITKNKKTISKEPSVDKAKDSIIETCDNLYIFAEGLVKKGLNINIFDDARNIYKLFLSKKKQNDNHNGGSKNIFIQNLILNLIDFAKNLNFNLIDSTKKMEKEVERNRNIKNQTETSQQELEAMIETNRRNSGDNIGGASFFVSFSDVISVLLCFFILFFSLGKVDAEKAKKLASTFQEETIKVNTFNAYVSEKEFAMMEKVKILLKANVDLDSIAQGKRKTIDHIVSGADYYSPGETEISTEGSNLIKEIIKKNINDEVKEIIIEGHTDDKELTVFPEIKNKYINNLGLSVVRASKVAKLIVEYIGHGEKAIGIRGYGSKRPLKTNTSDYFRALNRRVVIQIIKSRPIDSKKATSVVAGSEQN